MSSPLSSTIPLTLLGTERVFEGTDTTKVPFTIKLPASHAANGFRVVNSADSVLFSVDQSGNITIAGSISAVINETLTGDVDLTGTLTVAGATTLNGNITLGNAATDTLNVYANSIFRSNATVWNDLQVNNDVYVSHALNFEDVASTPNSSGNHGKVYTQIVSGVIELHYIDSSGNIVQITSAGAIGGDSMQLDDDEYLGIGNTAASPDVRLGWNTTQTVDALFLGLSDAQNTFVIAENGDRAYDFAHGAQTNPTVYLQSAAQSATEFSAWNAGKISFGLGIATVATDYVVGRNADATNLLQFNVPTGASFEFSVNDVAQMTMSATAVNFQDNSLTTTGGGSLTGTWTDLGIVTTVDINGGTVDGTIIGGAAAAAGTFTAIVGTSLDLNGALDLDVAALGATITNTADTASSQIAIFEGDRATVADGDEAYLTFRLSDSAGNQDEGARITWKATTVLSGATQDTDLILSALVNNVLTTMLTLDGSANEIVPAVAINSAAAITGTAITGTSFVIGANTLTTTEWAFLDGQDQSVFTTSNPTFGNLTITSFAANWTNAGRTVADLGIVTTVDINGGTLDGVTIGGAAAAAGTFTTITGSTAGNVLTLTNSTDAASVQVGIIQGDRATVADGDEAYLTFRLSDSAGNQDEGARITWKATTVLSGATQDTDLIFSALVNNVLTESFRIDGSAGGFVGINAPAPSEWLEVNGNISITNNNRLSLIARTGTNGGQMFWNNGTGTNITLAETASNVYTFGNAVAGTAPSNNVLSMNTSTGDVGIGTATPLSRLNVVGSNVIFLLDDATADASNKQGRFATTHYTNAEEPVVGLNITNTSGANTVNVGGGTSLGNAATIINLYTAANSTTTTGTVRMIINSAGNVTLGSVDGTGAGNLAMAALTATTGAFSAASGIVTNTSSTGTNAVYYSLTNTGGTAYLGQERSVGGGLLTGTAAYATVLMPANGRLLQFGYSDAGVAATIATDGKVGIGTATPQGLLDVNNRFVVNATAKTLTDAATNLFEVALTTGTMTGGSIIWTIEASDGTDHQALSGVTTYAAVNKAGAYTTTVNNNTGNDSKAVSAGTLTTTWDILTGTNKVTLRVTPTGSLTETTYRISYTVSNNNAQAITIL